MEEIYSAYYKWARRKSYNKKNSINLDITNRCTLACSKCGRVNLIKYGGYKNNKFPGGDLTIENFEKYLKFYDMIHFCGQIADPLMHSKLPYFLKRIKEENKEAKVHTAISHRPLSFFKECWEAHPQAVWTFGIDGLPKDSHKYRVNQDGQKLFDIMAESTKYIDKTIWQYIVFKYNENDIEEAKQLAIDNNINFHILISSRFEKNDKLAPTDLKISRDWRT